MNFKKPRLSLGNRTRKPFLRLILDSSQPHFYQGMIHGDLTDAAQLPRGRTVVFPELSVADGIPST